jgi:hypothetical protein
MTLDVCQVYLIFHDTNKNSQEKPIKERKQHKNDVITPFYPQTLICGWRGAKAARTPAGDHCKKYRSGRIF